MLKAPGRSAQPPTLKRLTFSSALLRGQSMPVEMCAYRRVKPGDDERECSTFAFIKHTFAFPRREPPELCMNLSPFETEGAGNAGRPMRPKPRVQNKTKHTSIVTTVTPESPGIPRAMVLTVSFVLSSVTMLFCHRRLADMVLSKP